jgi:hypothetical protein
LIALVATGCIRMNEDRHSMYSGCKSKSDITREWVDKTSDFLAQAFARNTSPFGVLCPCNHCYNRKPQTKSKMIEHLVNNGFRPGYTVWVHHGEHGQSRSDVIRQRTDDGGVVGQNPPTGVDRQHKSREAWSLYPSALQLTRALRLRFVGRAT